MCVHMAMQRQKEARHGSLPTLPTTHHSHTPTSSPSGALPTLPVLAGN